MIHLFNSCCIVLKTIKRYCVSVCLRMQATHYHINLNISNRNSNFRLQRACAMRRMAPKGKAKQRGKRSSATEELADVLTEVFGNIEVTHERQIARLWAGYGVIREVVLTDAKGNDKQLIVKDVKPRIDKSVSCQRKLQSYVVEGYFYKHLAATLPSTCKVPSPKHVHVAGNEKFLFVLEDLRSNYPADAYMYNEKQAKSALRWLANFHGHFWGQVGANRPSGLHSQGSYWYLDTRQDEFASIPKQWSHLAELAPYLDKRLKGFNENGEKDLRNRTIIHGDFKCENVLFDSQMQNAAVYDFQYCGEGYGARDLAYMMTSSVEHGLLGKQKEEELLRYYHEELKTVVEQKGSAFEYKFSEFVEHYELSILDLVRFLAGWGLWGNTQYLVQKTQQIITERGLA